MDECETMMNDSTGPGNCYTQSKAQKCCETCPKYYNASIVGMSMYIGCSNMFSTSSIYRSNVSITYTRDVAKVPE